MTEGPVRRSMLFAAALGALAASAGSSRANPILDRPEPRYTPAQTARWRDQRGYPQTGTGKRQGERLARQKAKWMLNYSASDKCLARIRQRQQQSQTVSEPK